MRNLIEREQKQAVVCDNVDCDYEILNDENAMYSKFYIDMPCPKCGENLLTLEDYLMHEKLVKTVNFVNKWFSWLTIFSGKVKPEDMKSISVHVHDGIKLSETKSSEKEKSSTSVKLIPQTGISRTCNLKDSTWTFDMKEDFSAFAGEFVIVPAELYEDMIVKLKAIKLLNEMDDSKDRVKTRLNWLLNELEIKN